MIKKKKKDIDGKTGETQNKYLSTFIIEGMVCDEEYLETACYINIRKVWRKAHLYCYYRNFKKGKCRDQYMDVEFLSVQTSISLWHKIELCLHWSCNNKIYDLTLPDYGLRNFQTIKSQFGQEYQGKFITVRGLMYSTHQTDCTQNSFDIFVET